MPLKRMISREAMRFFDLHCDSLTRAYRQGESLSDMSGNISVNKSKKLKKYRQCFAIFIPDGIKGEPAFSYFKDVLLFYERERGDFEKTNIEPVLTAENGNLLGGRTDNLTFFKKAGVRMLTLTWNGENDLGYGCECGCGGLKTFGKIALREMEKRGIIVDVSHLNEDGFRDVERLCQGSFVASHSNCYEVTPHVRNLKDRQLEAIIERGGLIGLTFHLPFLKGAKECTYEAVYKNICHILSLGGENSIALGSDFDGGVMPYELDCPDRLMSLYAYLRGRGLDEVLLEKVLWGNGERFLTES